jgi:hypothetical protein
MTNDEQVAKHLSGWNADFVPWPEEILTDEKTALMTERAFDKLPEYSCSTPSGTYTGKRWKTKVWGEWWMREYGAVWGMEICILSRRIILV